MSISDHFHPWVTEQGHSPFVWSVLGALAEATDSIGWRWASRAPPCASTPAIVAHAAATSALLLEGRFVLGLGTGEALNEHILGHRWPPPETRRAMLAEAVEVMRSLWTGETVDHDGDFYRVENARLFDVPEARIPLVISGFGQESVELAARVGDGFWGHSPDADVIERYRDAGGEGPRYAQVRLCWDTDEDRARETVHRRWPNQGLSGQLVQDLPTFTHFEQATSMLTVDQTAGSVPCGPDPTPVLEAVGSFLDAGYDHVYLHQVGGDVEGFVRFWRDELSTELSGRAVPRPAAGADPVVMDRSKAGRWRPWPTSTTSTTEVSDLERSHTRRDRGRGRVAATLVMSVALVMAWSSGAGAAPGDPSGVVADWRFEERRGASVLTDSSGFGRDGRIGAAVITEVRLPVGIVHRFSGPDGRAGVTGTSTPSRTTRRSTRHPGRSA